MAEKQLQRPLRSDELFRKPPAVDYINKKLGHVHRAFTFPPVHYDEASSAYVPDTQPLVTQLQSQPRHTITTSPTQTQQLPSTANQHVVAQSPTELVAMPSARTEFTDISAMKYWNLNLPVAVEKFGTTVGEPKKKLESKFSIRDKTDWDQIYDALEQARNVYLGSGGVGGWLRRVRRSAVDKVAVPVSNVVGIANKLTPEDPYATPVLGAVELLIDALKCASEIRSKTLAAFDGLIPIFADVELFLGTFPRDGSIKTASTDLVVAVLTAIEKTITFFLSNAAKRTGKAIFMGKDYEKSLVESLDEIKTKSTELMEQAIKSHIHEVHMYSQETHKLLGTIFKEQRAVSDCLNSVQELLSEHVKRQDDLLEKAQQRMVDMVAAAQQHIYQLEAQNERLRSNQTLVLSQSFVMPSNEPATAGWYMSPETLRDFFNARDFDLEDIEFIRERADMLSSSERATAEQIVDTDLFRSWIVSTSSSKLLVEWQSAKTAADISPLTHFCTTLAQALRPNQRFLSLYWFCGRHSDTNETPFTGVVPMMTSLIDQLLRQFPLDTSHLCQFVNLQTLSEADLSELVNLFVVLLAQVPRTVTLLCIIDGLVYYERDEFAEAALPVLSYLVSLTTEQNMPTTFKLLFTSCPSTHAVREEFEEEDLILNVDTMPRLTWAPSEDRVMREMREG